MATSLVGNIPNGKRCTTNRAGAIAVSRDAIFYTLRALDGDTQRRFPDPYSQRHFSAIPLRTLFRAIPKFRIL